MNTVSGYERDKSLMRYTAESPTLQMNVADC